MNRDDLISELKDILFEVENLQHDDISKLDELSKRFEDLVSDIPYDAIPLAREVEAELDWKRWQMTKVEVI